jgi:hypothetical protein
VLPLPKESHRLPSEKAIFAKASGRVNGLKEVNLATMGILESWQTFQPPLELVGYISNYYETRQELTR